MFANRGMHKHSPSKRPSHKVQHFEARLFSKDTLICITVHSWNTFSSMWNNEIRQTDQGTVCAETQSSGIIGVVTDSSHCLATWVGGLTGQLLLTNSFSTVMVITLQTDCNRTVNRETFCRTTDPGHYILLPMASLWPTASWFSRMERLLLKKTELNSYSQTFIIIKSEFWNSY